jgi:tetratricopeptide (TPR) repeat protein
LEAIGRWYPSPKHGFQTFAEAFHAGDKGLPGAQDALIKVLEDESQPALVRASAVARLGRYPSRKVFEALARALRMPDPDVRSAAIPAISRSGAAAISALLVPLLKDETRLVRMEAALALSGDAERTLSLEDKRLFDKALSEYVAGQLFNAERPESHTNLGLLYTRRGMPAEARAAFKEAMMIDPAFDAGVVSLADLERAVGDEKGAHAILQRALETRPKSATLLHALGLSLVRQKLYDKAIGQLAEAAALAPEEPRFSYVYAVALHGLGRKQEAMEALKSALAHHNYNRELLMTLLSYELESNYLRSALRHAELMVQLEPERADIRQLIDRLWRETR